MESSAEAGGSGNGNVTATATASSVTTTTNTRVVSRVPKSLFVLLACGICSFGLLIFLVRMPKPHLSEEEHIGNFEPISAASSEKQRRSLNNNQNRNQEICRTPMCLKTAQTLLDSINGSGNPCHDFYSYACGGWVSKNPIPPSVSKWSPFGVLDLEMNNLLQEILRQPSSSTDPDALKQARDFFKACSNIPALNKAGLKPVFQILRSYGGWPILSPSWNASSFNWMKSMADLKRMFGTSALFDIVSNQHTTTPAFSSVHLQQPSLFLSRPYLIYKDAFQLYIKAYKQLIIDLVKELKKSPEIKGFPDLGGSAMDPTYVSQQADEIIRFETEIAKIMRDGVELQYGLRNFSATLTLKYLQEIFVNYTAPDATNNIDMKQLLRFLFLTVPGVHPVHRINDNQLISMSDTNYVGNMFELLTKTPVRVLANYLHFRMMGWVVSGTTSEMRNIIHKFQSRVYGITEPSSRNYVCASSAEEKFGLALAQPYIKKAKIGPEAMRKTGEIMEQIRSTFIVLLQSAKWMDPSVKTSLLSKARGIQSCIGYAPWMSPANGTKWDEQTLKDHLNNHYKGLNITGLPTYLEKLFAVRTWQTDQKLKQLNERFIPGCKWTTFPGQIGAFYDIRRQTVNIPLGLLKPPFFYDGIPMAVNYGGLGSIVGHEFTHGFAVNGWTEIEGTGKFSPISQCLIDQYNRFKIPSESNLYINGALTLDENFPDNGGLMEAYKTFMNHNRRVKVNMTLPGLEKFSQEQLFFIGFANIWCSSSRREGLLDQVLQDHHTPNKYRVMGTLQNSKEFSEAWNCPLGSPMNPQKYKRCNAFSP